MKKAILQSDRTTCCRSDKRNLRDGLPKLLCMPNLSDLLKKQVVRSIKKEQTKHKWLDLKQ